MFSGQVVNIGKGEPGGAWRPATVTVSFQVSEVWKGPQPVTLEVSTSRDGASCGYPFKEGQEYLVYAYGKEEPPSRFLSAVRPSHFLRRVRTSKRWGTARLWEAAALWSIRRGDSSASG